MNKLERKARREVITAFGRTISFAAGTFGNAAVHGVMTYHRTRQKLFQLAARLTVRVDHDALEAANRPEPKPNSVESVVLIGDEFAFAWC